MWIQKNFNILEMESKVIAKAKDATDAGRIHLPDVVLMNCFK